MKMAKASDKDIAALNDFFQELEQAIEDGEYGENEYQDEFYDDSESGDHARMYAFIEKWWPRLRGSWGRVVHGCDTLIKNVCDPSQNVLDWKPELKAALERGGYKGQ